MRMRFAPTQLFPAGRAPGNPPGIAPPIIDPMSSLRQPSGAANSESGSLTFSTDVTSSRNVPRSEERRVGKEGRSRWWPDPLKKKKEKEKKKQNKEEVMTNRKHSSITTTRN